MRVLSRKTLLAFIAGLGSERDSARTAFEAWYHEAARASWRSPADVKERYRSASFVKDRVVFNLKGNTYRLVVAIDYQRQIVFIKWVGTHEAYDRIDVTEVEHGD